MVKCILQVVSKLTFKTCGIFDAKINMFNMFFVSNSPKEQRFIFPFFLQRDACYCCHRGKVFHDTFLTLTKGLDELQVLLVKP